MKLKYDTTIRWLIPHVEQFEGSVIDPYPVFNLFEDPNEFWSISEFFVPPYGF